MRRINLIMIFTVIIAFATVSCKKNKDGEVEVTANTEVHDHEDTIPIDNTQFEPFFAKYPDFKEFEGEIKKLYSKHNHYIWHDKRGLIEFADVLHNKVNQIDDEGLELKIPYKDKINEVFDNQGNKPDMESELLISSLYFYYTKNVLEGLDPSKSKQTGWYLPREKVDYVAYLDTLMQDPRLIKRDESELFSQYYNLKKGLKKYREIEKKGGWGTIALDEGIKSLKEGDSAAAVIQIRKRLALEGYLKNDSGKSVYDSDLADGLKAYEEKHNRVFDGKIGPAMVKELNVPVSSLIKTITVNMERCRWISPKMDKAPEVIAVNIPSFRLVYFKKGKPYFTSKVVVGKELNKTVVFSGEMSYLNFAPYWNVPTSILNKEIKPGIAKDPNYLSKHNMEWVGDRVRQKPGGQNSLGKVKFMFPNSNNIYLHDTPAKSLFNKDERAFSHGCVRVEKARDLAVLITKEDGNWTADKVDARMNAGKETTYTLKKKIPVYIAYFTAWADENGNVAFFDDVYKRDDRLASLLYAAK
ncbi:murein L,D-transpeptidase [Flavobacterium sp. NRK1]|uniref:L,D-transpeptidase family protein n=1 Tax=Flavobacterium sp. NRK1 TaxID=2954929 RepID=UPI002093D29B|nr:L,D-transpeptidase family protein [Flavobacterium sp. NRK1]MCO6149147.1 L,D-transpeptidase family protein [Flavobacterium sp. NRK1]